jgi:hypothetical protein
VWGEVTTGRERVERGRFFFSSNFCEGCFSLSFKKKRERRKERKKTPLPPPPPKSDGTLDKHDENKRCLQNARAEIPYPQSSGGDGLVLMKHGGGTKRMKRRKTTTPRKTTTLLLLLLLLLST